MRKLITTIAAVLAAAGAVFATHAATSATPSDASIVYDANVRLTGPSSGFYWMMLDS